MQLKGISSSRRVPVGKTPKWLAYFFLFCLFILALSLGGYHHWVFSNEAAKIDRILDSASIENRNPPKLVTAALLSENRNREIWGYVERYFYYHSGPDRKRTNIFGWIEHMLWWSLFRTRYDQDEIIALFCTIAWNGEGHGLEDLVTRLFKTPPSKADPEQLAFAVAVLRSPHLLGKDPGKLESLAREIFNEQGMPAE